MATRPVDPVQDWATDVNFPAGSDPWSGQPTKVVPAAGESAVGFEPGTEFPSELANYILSNHAAFLAYLDSEVTGGADTFTASAAAGVPSLLAGAGYWALDTTTEVKYTYLGAANRGTLVFDLSACIGAIGASIEITRVEAMVLSPNSNAMQLAVIEHALDFDTPLDGGGTIVASASSVANSTLQVIDSGPVSISLGGGSVAHAAVRTGSNGTDDEVYGVRITVDRSGMLGG